MQNIFPSGYFRDKNGEFVIDISRSDIVTDELFLIFSGSGLENIRINEIEVQTIDVDDVYYKKVLKVTEASDNTSYHTSEFQINDGMPGTYWAVRAPEEWGHVHWHVQQELEDRFDYNRSWTRWKEGFIELEMENPSSADLLKLLCQSEDAHGEMTIKVKESDNWQTVDVIFPWIISEGWVSYALDASWGDIQNVRLEVKGYRNELGGIGEIELWGDGDYTGKSYDDLLVPNFYKSEEGRRFL